MSVTAAYVLSMMLKGQPRTPIVTWGNTYESTAASIAKNVKTYPLFTGEFAEEQTASVMVSLGIMEGSLKPDAKGDCDKTDPKTGMCEPGSTPHSFCMFQVHESNHKFLGVTRDELLTDIDKCVVAGLRMAKASFSKCAHRPVLDRLNQYATGGDRCVAVVEKDKGIHRMRRAQWLFANSPRENP